MKVHLGVALLPLVAAGVVGSGVVGCSHVEVFRSRTDAEEGLHFYRPEPYLLVTATDKGSQVAVISLPNVRDRWVVRPWVGLGTVDVDVTLEGGWNLTSLGADTDSKIPETITALTGTLKEAASLTASVVPASFPPGLYRIVFAEDGSVAELKRVRVSAD